MRLRIKKTVSILLIALMLPLSSFAQGSGTGGNTGTSISGTHVIGAALQCTDALFGDKIDKLVGGLASSLGISGSSSSSSSGSSQVVPVGDSITQDEAEKIKKEEKKANKKEICTDGIVRAAVLEVMDAFTQDIINWINTGFEGEPSFVRNDGSFWKGIADQEIEGFTADIGFNAALYPFGRDYLLNMIASTQNYFRQKAAYSLDQVIGHGQQNNFQTNLAVGGWVGWDAIIEPQNNPFGFELIAQQEVKQRLVGTTSSRGLDIRKELDINGGFRSAKKCVDPEGYETPPAGWSRVEDELIANDQSVDATERQQAATRIKLYICDREEVQTPGKVISEQLTNVLNAPLERLQLADEMNEDITAIMDALMNQLIQQGLTSLTTEVAVTNTIASGGNFSAYAGINQNPNNPGFQNWTNGLPPPGYSPVNLGSTDPTNPDNAAALLTTQQNYITELGNLATEVQTLITKIYQLDYCIPGPRPHWLDDTDGVFQQLFINEPNVQHLSSDDPTSVQTQQANYYTNDVIQNLTNVGVAVGENIDSFNNYVDVINDIWNGYITQIDSRYFNTQQELPTMRVEASNLYVDIPNMEALYAELQQEAVNAALLIPDLTTVATIIPNQQQYGQQDSDQDGITDVDEAYDLFYQISPNLPTQGILDQLEQTAGNIADRTSITTIYLNDCKTEVAANGYLGDEGRLAYPTTLLSTAEQQAALPQGQGNTQNFLPTVSIIGDDTNQTDKIVIYDNPPLGVNVTNSTNVTTFESTLNAFNISGGTGILY
jgi:hypothetical protein